MGQRWFISDTHLGHHNILKYDGADRPFESVHHHDQTIAENWRRVVKGGDDVFHLGDVAFRDEGVELVRSLPGRKHLILGNHDKGRERDLIDIFDHVHGCHFIGSEIGKILLTHIPVHPSQFQYRCVMNIHGHLHRYQLQDDRYRNANVTEIGPCPIRFEDLLKRKPDPTRTFQE